jgi:hypothetical protein
VGKQTKALRREGHKVAGEAKKVTRGARSGARKVGRRLEKGSDNPIFERLARFGYIIRGVLYGVMGATGIGFALGIWHRTTDQRGALSLLDGNPFKVVAVVAVIAGLSAYSLWGFVRAIYDPLHRGDEPPGVVARLGFAWSGLSYAGLLVFTVQFLLGLNSGDGSDSIEKPIRFVMSHPFGAVLTLVIGVLAVLAGLGQFVDAVMAGFRKDLQRRKMSDSEEVLADSLGRFGMFSRGVIFTMLGWFIVEAAFNHDPGRAEGMGAAFQTLAQQPAGHLLLFVVAAGFIALALHSFACARWIKMGT